MAAALAHAADHLFVGEHRAQRGAPVDRSLRLIGQSMGIAILRDRRRAGRCDFGGDGQFGDRPALLLGRVEPSVEEDEEDPLRPADILRVGRRHHPLPVVAEAEHLELAGEGGDVSLGALPWRRAGADGVLLGRQAEGVEAHRVHHRRAPHPLEPRDDVGRGVALRVADVQSVAARVGEHVEHVGLAGRRESRRGEGVVRVPPVLPLRFNARRLVTGHRRGGAAAGKVAEGGGRR